MVRFVIKTKKIAGLKKTRRGSHNGNGTAKRATNLYLTRSIYKEAVAIAERRYELSPSDLVDALLLREVQTKGGLLHATLKTRSG